MNFSIKKFLKFAISVISPFISEQIFAQQIKPVPEQFELEKVVIFSRHNLRSPLTKEGSELSKVTPYKWSDWSVETGYLTHKGTILETYFGQYLNQWLTQKGLLNKKLCESGEQIEVYANSLQRTIATGQAIISGAFAGCNVNIKHKLPIGKMDDVFNPIIRTDEESFIKEALSRIDLVNTHRQLEKAYALLSDVINFKNSEKCLVEKKCEFFDDEGKLRIKNGKEPGVSGTMRLSKNIVDALLLQYYEGIPLEQIVNNRINSKEKWCVLNNIKNDYQFMLRGDPFIAKHIALPLLQYIKQDLNGENKITILVGHDSNIIVLLSALDINKYSLPEQDENTPIGGKVFIEVWKDKMTQEKKIKLEYVYQSTEQLRKLQPLNLSKPAMHQTLQLKQCESDQYGLCDYTKFNVILEQAINSAK